MQRSLKKIDLAKLLYKAVGVEMEFVAEIQLFLP